MNIALDYDGTYTVDPHLWLRFVLDAQACGHHVYVVTMRYPSECEATQVENPFDMRLPALKVPVIATSRLAKRTACEQLGIQVHVWIDDNPRAINEDAKSIWKWQTPEGQPVVPEHG